ncbi:hypothetical protein [Roseomonas gilardii]|uniref:hypothetical protein n=1 Tax=Roseomonas gilardii TaxID=257708 RepID=UPI0012EBAF0E|nr:hypothetical protein [Roseomonas gilardii]
MISANGPVSTAVVPDHELERYTLCLRIGDQAPCAPVRPGRYEALLPGSPVAPSHTSATTYLAGSVEQIKKSGHAALTVHPAGLAVHQPPSRA